MKKISRLMLIGASLLAFSSVSFGADDNDKTNPSSDLMLIKIKSTGSYYAKSDDQSAISAIPPGLGKWIVAKKCKLHTTVYFNSDLKPVFIARWEITEAKHPRIVYLGPAEGAPKDAPKAEVTSSPSSDEVEITVHDQASPSDKPATGVTGNTPARPQPTPGALVTSPADTAVTPPVAPTH